MAYRGVRVLVLLLFVGLVALVQAQEDGGGKSVKTLPTVPKGKWQGKHAVYEHQNFNAYMDNKGYLWIQCLENGKDVGKPFTCYQVNAVYYPPKSHQHSRPIISFENPPKPKKLKSGDKLKLCGTLKEDIPFEVQYEFKGNTITASAGCKDHGGISFPTTILLLSSMKKSHDIPEQMEQEDREKLLKNCLVITKEKVAGRKKTIKYPYYDTIKFKGAVETGEVRGPYGKRVVQFKPERGPGTFHGWAYESYCPWQGYCFYLRIPGKEIELRKYRATMVVR